MISIDDYTYDLPESLIAQTPAQPRDSSRLLVLDRKTGKQYHHHFRDIISWLTPDDVLVLNNTQVFPARLKGTKNTGKKVEVMLLRQVSSNRWWAMSFPGLKIHNRLSFGSSRSIANQSGSSLAENLLAKVIERDNFSGHVLLEFNQNGRVLTEKIYQIGYTPIPPYIAQNGLLLSEEEKEVYLREKYQTVFAQIVGSAAAPTAGLHFTPDLLKKIKQKGVQVETITLHVGPGTFQRLWQENIDQNKLHTEWYEITPEVSKRLVLAKKQGKRIIAVGTTSTRTLESAIVHTQKSTSLKTGWQTTELFINPPYKFQFIDGLITNFHLPESSLLMLVASFTSFPQTSSKYKNFSNSLIGTAYQTAISEHYRFYSFGDAMLIV